MKFTLLFLLIFLAFCNTNPETNKELFNPLRGIIGNWSNAEGSDSAKAKVSPLDSTDFIVNGLSTDIRLKAITHRFGKPDSISNTEYTLDSEIKISTWYYKDIIFTFIDDSTCLGFYINSNKFSTKRGLTIGDPVAKMIKLYGENNNSYNENYFYMDENEELHLIRITAERGKVKEIYLGYILD